MSADFFRVYHAVGKDGYPPEWHKLTYDDLGIGVLTEREPGIKHLVREAADHRCVRCKHPYTKGDGEWSPCTADCSHTGPMRLVDRGGQLIASSEDGAADWQSHVFVPFGDTGWRREAQWRILTVHHLNGNKADCRWWNLVSLCQRCHLRVQRVVLMERVWPWEHSEWFKPYVAGYYAHAYLGEDLSREQAEARLDELLALELQAGAA